MKYSNVMEWQKLFFPVILVFCLTTSASAQYGTVDNSLSITSEILDQEVSYSVYLPESYHTSTRAYPIVYLLHGMTGNSNDWITMGEVQRIAGTAMATGKTSEMIIVMPDGLYDSFYINNYDGSENWEDFFHEELIPQVEEKFRVTSTRNFRAIAGLSMGGYGATYHAVKYPDKFSAVYAMSAAFLEVEPVVSENEGMGGNQELYQEIWGPLNEEGLPENYEKHSIQEMFKTMDTFEQVEGTWFQGRQGETPLPRIYIECGDDDFLLNQNMNFVKILNEKNVPFEFRVRDGGHTWEYWRPALANMMEFFGDSFRN